MNRVALDHNAGSPLRAAARARLMELLETPLGNPSSLHAEGRRARDVLEEAREDLAGWLGCDRDELVFTSGGTESNALALHQAPLNEGVAATATEHPSTLAAIRARSDGQLLPVDEWGRLEHSVPTPRVALISVSLANHETGALQDLDALIRQARDVEARLHIDLCQALGRIPVELDGIDLATLSAHKLGGLPGIGALIVRGGSTLTPLWRGGGQEAGQRPGTESAQLAAVFAAAAGEALRDVEGEAQRLGNLTTHLRQRLTTLGAQLRFITPESGALPNTLNVAFDGRRGAHLVLQLDQRGVSVSHGSACSSGSAEPSAVLLAMGLGEDVARSSLRISLGHNTSRAHVDEFVSTLRSVLVDNAIERA